MTSPTVTKSSWLQPKSLKTKLLFSFLVLGMVPMATVGVLAYRSAYQALSDRAGQRMQFMAVDVADKIDRNLFERFGDVQAFAFNPMAQESPDKVTAAANFYTESYGCYDLMVIADAEGKVVACNTVTFERKPLDTSRLIGQSVKGQDWFDACIGGQIPTGTAFVSDAIAVLLTSAFLILTVRFYYKVTPMKVLVVDDSKAMRMIVIRTLKQAGINNLTTIEAGSGVEGLAMVADHKPHAILSDWNMPEMKGIDFLKKLREDGNDTLFGFVTSECSPEVKKEAEDAGAKFFIVKPFTPNSFEAALAPVLAN